MVTQKKERPLGVASRPTRIDTQLGVILTILIYMAIIPEITVTKFAKVEESFNLHATHDVLMYGVGSSSLHNYDHFKFPGAVPRTFVGSVFVAWIVKIILRIGGWRLDRTIHPKLWMQILVRMVLGFLSIIGLHQIRMAVDRRFDHLTSSYFWILIYIQAHLPFWIGRTIPNTFAFLPVTLALSLLIGSGQGPIRNKPSKFNLHAAIALLTFTTVIFRAEVLLLLAPVVLQSLYLRYTSFKNIVLVGLIAGLASLCLTVTVDSYFWGQPYVWPELYSLYFNVYQGKSVEWGASPPLAYFTTHLPKILMSSFPLSIVGFVVDHRIRTFLLPSLVFVTLMSFLSHKEWRFIIYVVPAFTVAAARGATWMTRLTSNRFHTMVLRTCFLLSLCGMMTANIAMKYVFREVSKANYPGGDAMILFHETYTPNYTTPLSTPPHVHICNLAAQTGASLFTQFNGLPYYPPYVEYIHNDSSPFRIPPAPWTYNKTENLSIRDLTLSPSITHLISEISPTSEEGVNMEKDWKLVVPVRTRSHFVPSWNILKGEWPWHDENKLWIYERQWSQV